MTDTPVSAILVDDEPHARAALRHLLAAHPQIHILAECENGKAAVKAVHELAPQLMFLDIHMPKLDGFEVLELLGNAAPLVIFVTAHDDYAIQAFERNALDYLLKPVNKARLATSLGRIPQRLAVGAPTQPEQQATQHLLQQRQQGQAPLSRLLIRDKGDVHVLPTQDIVAIEAADDYVVIHTAQARHIKQERLANLETRLDPQQFCRIHRSTLINLDFLAGIETEGKETRLANVKDGRGGLLQFAISRGGYAKLLERL